jgi:hypothetical protein
LQIPCHSSGSEQLLSWKPENRLVDHSRPLQIMMGTTCMYYKRQ